MKTVAIIGAGIGAEHLAGYRALPDTYRVAVLCDLNMERAAQAADGDPDIHIVNDLDEVLSDPTIDIVDVCLPPHLHLSTVVQVLAADKHAICEKPLARSCAEIDEMAAAIATSKGRVFPVFQYRYGHALARLNALKDAGLTGSPLVASAETHWCREADYYAVPWRGTWQGEAGGAILGHAIHAHDLISYVMGPVAQVSALLDTRANDIEVDDCAAISLRLANGALATSSVTLGAASDTTRLRFCFAGLTAESGTAPYTPAQDAWTFTARGGTAQADIDRVIDAVPTPLAGFAGFLEAVSSAIEGRDHDAVSFADGAQSIALVTALYTSAREGRAVDLPIGVDDALYHGWQPA